MWTADRLETAALPAAKKGLWMRGNRHAAAGMLSSLFREALKGLGMGPGDVKVKPKQDIMKTTRFSAQARFPSRVLRCCLVVAALGSATAFGDFSGGDTLAAQGKKWASFTGFGKPGGGEYVFQNSRLEFLVESPTTNDLSILRWTPNKGGYDQDWFIQVDVHLDKVALNRGSHTNLNLGVINTKNRKQGYMAAIDRYRDGRTHVSGFETSTVAGLNDDYQKSPALDATLRIHFDSAAKTLTSSWKSGAAWKYFPSVKIAKWGMDKSGTFTAILAASGGGDDDGRGRGPVIRSGEAFFSNFKAGDATPDIAIEQPAGSDLADGNSKKSLGSASIRSGGMSKTFTIRNSGTAGLGNLKIAKAGPDAADFTITGPAKTLVKPGATATFKVLFKPKTTGTKNAIINILSNDPDESHFDIQVSGEGVK